MLSELPILPATRAFLERKLKMRIGADWQDAASGRTLSFRNPATGEVLGEVPAAEAEDVDRAVRAARQAMRRDRPDDTARGRQGCDARLALMPLSTGGLQTWAGGNDAPPARR